MIGFEKEGNFVYNGLANDPSIITLGKTKHRSHGFFWAGPTNPTKLWCGPHGAFQHKALWFITSMFIIYDIHLTSSTC